MELYILTKQGVYCQGEFGVFDSIELARESAIAAAQQDRDSYHDWIVTKYTLNEFTKDYIEPVFQIKK